MDFERQCEGYDIETMTGADLLSWANGLQVCRFEPSGDGIVCDGDGARIELDLDRFASDSAPDGVRHVGVYTEDRRGGCSGCCSGFSDLRKAAEEIEQHASKLGLMRMQLSLF